MNRTCVNLGCGDTYVEGWLNLDYSSNSPAVKRVDLLTGLPVADNAADVVYSSHFIEHIPRELVVGFLRECFRITKTGGRLRLVFPDWEELCATYLALRRKGEHERADFLILEMIDQLVRRSTEGELGDYYARLQFTQPRSSEMIEFVKERTGYDVLATRSASPAGWKQVLSDPKTLIRKLERIYVKGLIALLPSAFRNQNVAFADVGAKHAWMYDFHSVKELLLQVGFSDVCRLSAATSRIPDFPIDALDLNPDGTPRKGIESIFMEAVKP